MKFGFKNPLTKEGTVAFATVLGVILLVSGVVYFNTRQGQKVSPVLPATTEMPTVEPTEEPTPTPEEAPTATESAVTD